MVHPFHSSIPGVNSGYFLSWRIADDSGNSLATCCYFNSDIVFILCLCRLAILLAILQDMVYGSEINECILDRLVRQISMILSSIFSGKTVKITT